MAFTVTNRFKPGNLLFLQYHKDYIMVDCVDFAWKDVPGNCEYLGALFYSNKKIAKFVYYIIKPCPGLRDLRVGMVLELNKSEINTNYKIPQKQTS